MLLSTKLKVSAWGLIMVVLISFLYLQFTKQQRRFNYLTHQVMRSENYRILQTWAVDLLDEKAKELAETNTIRFANLTPPLVSSNDGKLGKQIVEAWASNTWLGECVLVSWVEDGRAIGITLGRTNFEHRTVIGQNRVTIIAPGVSVWSAEQMSTKTHYSLP